MSFVGYPKETKGYYFYNSSENKAFVAQNAIYFFKENTYPKELVGVKFSLNKFEHHKKH